MRKILIKILVIFSPLIFFGLSSSAQSQTYKLICKGGPGMAGSVWHYTSNGVLGVEIDLVFKRGTVAGNPGPGECVWLIRRMFPADPTELRVYLPAPNSQKFAVTYKEIYNGPGPILEIVTAMKNGQHFRVMAEIGTTALYSKRIGWD